MVGIKNLRLEEIDFHATNLRRHTNDRSKPIKSRVKTKTPSIQGEWTIDTFAQTGLNCSHT